MTELLRMHDIVLVDGSLVLRPMTEEDWETVAAWNNDPAVLWFTDNGAVSERSLEELQSIHRGVSRAADLFVFELDGVPVGDGWVQRVNLDRIIKAFPGRRLARVDLQLSSTVWGQGVGTRVLRLLTGHAFDRGDDLVFGCDIADFNDRSRRTFLGCGYVPWRRVLSPPGESTTFVHDLVCRPELFYGTAAVQEHPGDDRIMAGDSPFGATVVVYRRVPELEVLLLHRAVNGPDYEGDWAWTPPAGARFPAEPIDECAARELHEEIGLEMSPRRVEGPENQNWALYFLEVPEDVAIRLDAEHDRYEWVRADDATGRCLPGVVAGGVTLVITALL